MARRPITSPWTDKEDEQLRQLHTQGVSLLRAAGVVKRSMSAVRVRARKLELEFPGVRETKRKIRAAELPRGKYDLSPKW